MSVSAELKTGEKKNTLWTIYEEQTRIIEHHTGVSSHLILIGLGVCLAFVFIGYFDIYITNIVGILYPAYWSIKAIESSGVDDDKQWLTYWVVFGLFSIIDLFSGFILHFIPFYFFIKLSFLIWCFMPNFKGAIFVYDKFLVKLFKKYETVLDKVANDINGGVGNVYKEGTTYIKENKTKIITKGFEVAQSAAELANDKSN